MFGKNEVASPDQQADGSLNINSIFYTIQGEGPDAGSPAIFIRLARCNLRCYFCDTDFAQGNRMSVEEVIEQVMPLAEDNQCRLVVITGGEPFLQNICPLVRALNDRAIRVSVETAGTVWLDGVEQLFPGPLRSAGWQGNMIVCSPKTPKLNPRLADYVGAFKYIVREGEIDPLDGLPIMSTQLEGEQATIYRPTLIQEVSVPIFLQPMDEGDPEQNKINACAAAAACMKHGYRLSMQLHKMTDLP